MEKPKEKIKFQKISEAYQQRNQHKFIPRRGRDADDFSDLENPENKPVQTKGK